MSNPVLQQHQPLDDDRKTWVYDCFVCGTHVIGTAEETQQAFTEHKHDRFLSILWAFGTWWQHAVPQEVLADVEWLIAQHDPEYQLKLVTRGLGS